MTLPFPDKKYPIIYAYPPWSYNDKMSGHSFSLDHEYETQTIDWIKQLPVKTISDCNCLLFMWIVSPMLPEAVELMTSWGFEYASGNNFGQGCKCLKKPCHK